MRSISMRGIGMRGWCIFTLVAGFHGIIHAQATDQKGKVSQFARDDIPTCLEELDLGTRGNLLNLSSPSAEDVRSAVFEIRTADNARRVATIAVPQNAAISLFSSKSIQEQIFLSYPTKDSPSVPAGEYAAAWIINGERRSNVIRLTVDPRKDAAKLPLVRMTQLEPEKAGMLPDFVAYVTRGKESDPAPDHMTVASGTLIVDGVPLVRSSGAYTGPNSPLPVGGTYCKFLSLGAVQEPIDPSKPHVVSALIGEGSFAPQQNPGVLNGLYQTSAPVKLETDTPLADAWDKKTAGLRPVPEITRSLSGTVLDDPPAQIKTGVPGVGRYFAVTISSKDFCCQGLTFGVLPFEFRNIPSGTYTLTCRPRGQKSPILTVESVALDAAALPPALQLPFAGTFELAGKIAHADGTPAAKVAVTGQWISDDGKMTYDVTTSTDGSGGYTMRAPFAKNRTISYRDGETEVRVERNAAGSSKDQNFRLSK